MDFRLLASALMGWTLGANDTASVFGLAITTRLIKPLTALTLTAGFIVLGAVLQGYAGIETYAALGQQTAWGAFVISLVPALTLWGTATLGLPVSATQAVVGAATGMALLQGGANWAVLAKLGVSWALAPLGTLLFAMVFYWAFSRLLHPWLMGLSSYEVLLKAGFVVVGSYGAFSLGANNVANVTGVWVSSGAISATTGVWLGSLSMAAGVLTYSSRVIDTLGRKLANLDAFSAFIAMFSSALTLHLYALAGVPVSASQAAVGAVLGIGLVKGVSTVQHDTVLRIMLAWFVVPLITGVLALVGAWLLP